MDKNIAQQKPRLLDQVKQGLCYKHYSLSAEKVYVYWILFFIRWSGLRHPADMGAPEVEAFLTMLATERHVSPSTHKQALSAILFLYKELIQTDLPWMQQIGRPKAQQRLPVVFTTLQGLRLLTAYCVMRLTGPCGAILETVAGAMMRWAGVTKNMYKRPMALWT